MAGLQDTRLIRLEDLHQKLEQRLQKFDEIHRNLDERIQSEHNNSHQFEVRLNTTLEERLQSYSAQINQLFQKITQSYTPLEMHQEMSQTVANRVPLQNFSDLQKHVQNVQVRLTNLDTAFTDNHNEMVEFQTQLVAKMEEMIVQTDALNTTAASERKVERDERTTQVEDLRQRLSAEYEQRIASHRQLEGKHNELSQLQSDGFKVQAKNLESEHEAWKRADQELEAKLRTLINESLSRESDERRMQLQDMFHRLENGHQMHTDMHNQLESRMEEHREKHHKGLKAEREERTTQLEELGGRLGRETINRDAQVQEVMNRLENRLDAMENLTTGFAEMNEYSKQDILKKLAALKEELSNEHKNNQQQFDQTTTNARDELNKKCDKVEAEGAKKISILQGTINGLMAAAEADRMTFREAREEQIRTLQSEREARNRQNAEIRADYKREILKEHQERVDDAADQRKDIFRSLRTGTPTTGQGASLLPDLASLEGPGLEPAQRPGPGIGLPKLASLDELPELDKKHSISSLGKRLSVMGSISPTPMMRCPVPE